MTVDLAVRTLTYGTDKRIDIYHPQGADLSTLPVVLLWHGRGPDERDVLQPLAQATAHLDVQVLVPDWRSDAPDGGRTHLLDSLRFTQDYVTTNAGNADRIVLAGWSAGASAAMGVTLHPELVDGWRPLATVGIASRYDWPARTSESSPLHDLATTSISPVPVRLVHGSADTVIEPQHSRLLATTLEDHGWPVRLDEPDTDHAGAIMTEYDPALDRCVPTRAEHALHGGLLTAHVLAQAASIAFRR